MSHPILTQEQLQTMLKQFLEERGAEFHLSALGYFGSYARKEAKPDSDVDIVFKTRRPISFHNPTVTIGAVSMLKLVSRFGVLT